MLATAWIYILTNKNNTTLYIGVTNDLSSRLWEHKTKQNPKCFTAKYNLYKLIFYKGFDTIEGAIEQEKYIKGKKRKWKNELIQSVNAEWKDLTTDASLNITR